jgi:hypothetical protein
VGTLSESFSLPEAGTTPTLVVSLLVVCGGAGTVCVSVRVSVTVVVRSGPVRVVVSPGVVTVVVGSAPFTWVVVPVVPPADWIPVLTLFAAVEAACCTVPLPQALSAQAINAPATNASASLAVNLGLGAFKPGSEDACEERDTGPSVGERAVARIIPFG